MSAAIESCLLTKGLKDVLRVRATVPLSVVYRGVHLSVSIQKIAITRPSKTISKCRITGSRANRATAKHITRQPQPLLIATPFHTDRAKIQHIQRCLLTKTLAFSSRAHPSHRNIHRSLRTTCQSLTQTSLEKPK